jgi:hypothetical protein
VVGTILASGLAKLGGQRSDSSHQPSASLASNVLGCSQHDSVTLWISRGLSQARISRIGSLGGVALHFG